MKICGEHDNRESKDIGSISAGKHPLVGVASTVAGGKLLHQTINLLRLSWQSEAFQEQPQSLHQVLVLEVKEVDIAVHHCLVQLLSSFTSYFQRFYFF